MFFLVVASLILNASLPFYFITAKSLSIDSQQLAKRWQANQEGRIY